MNAVLPENDGSRAWQSDINNVIRALQAQIVLIICEARDVQLSLTLILRRGRYFVSANGSSQRNKSLTVMFIYIGSSGYVQATPNPPWQQHV